MHDPFRNGSNISPTPPINESLRADARRFGKLVAATFHWTRRKPAISPGAYNYAFDSLGLVEFDAIGAAYAVKRMPMPFQKPLNALYGVPTVGYAGLVGGQMMMTPLYDPNNNTFGGYPLPS